MVSSLSSLSIITSYFFFPIWRFVSLHKAEHGHSLGPKFYPWLKAAGRGCRAFSEFWLPSCQGRESEYLPLVRDYSWSNYLWSKGHVVQTCSLGACMCECWGKGSNSQRSAPQPEWGLSFVSSPNTVKWTSVYKNNQTVPFFFFFSSEI